jgi:peptide/nickel transport system substrate-binding protein
MNKLRALMVCALVVACLTGAAPAQSADVLISKAEVGQAGGRLVVPIRTEPKTFNPAVPLDQPTRDVVRRLHADLIHIDRNTLKTEPALAKSWTVSPDGRTFTLKLRRGLKFSDGHPFTADDVVFSFQLYLDEKLHSPQRDLLIVNGKPIAVSKIDSYTVRFAFAQSYAAGDRVFDSLAMLPRHLLEADFKAGKLAEAWGLNTSPDKIAGLGPFRLKRYTAGQSITLERNPYFWAVDSAHKPLPYLDEMTFIVVPSEDAQVLRFQSGETDVVTRISADNFAALGRQQSRGFTLYDSGPSLEYNFLLLNMNDDVAGRLPEIARKQQWFRDVRFRQAVSAALDRQGIVRLVYLNRAAPIWWHISPGNRDWFNKALPQPARDLNRARSLLREAGFKWNSDGTLTDASGQVVTFSILAPSNNAQRSKMAAIIQDDLKQIGMRVNVVPMEFRAYVDRITNTHDYEAAVMALGPGDSDPTAELNVWLSNGTTHLWNLGEKKPATAWEAEIDKLLEQQTVTMQYARRKQMIDRLQQIEVEQVPIICLVSPYVLSGAKSSLGNFRPAILEHYTLHNAEELFWRKR